MNGEIWLRLFFWSCRQSQCHLCLINCLFKALYTFGFISINWLCPVRQLCLGFRLHISDILFNVISSSALVNGYLSRFHRLSLLIATETHIISLDVKVIACGWGDSEDFLGHMRHYHDFDSLEDEISRELIHQMVNHLFGNRQWSWFFPIGVMMMPWWLLASVGVAHFIYKLLY